MVENIMDTALGSKFLKGVKKKGHTQLLNAELSAVVTDPWKKLLRFFDRLMNHEAGLAAKMPAFGLVPDFEKAAPNFESLVTRLAREGGILFNPESDEISPEQVASRWKNK